MNFFQSSFTTPAVIRPATNSQDIASFVANFADTQQQLGVPQHPPTNTTVSAVSNAIIPIPVPALASSSSDAVAAV